MREITRVIKTKMAVVKAYNQNTDSVEEIKIIVDGRGKIENKMPPGYSYLKLIEICLEEKKYAMDIETFMEMGRVVE